MSLNPVVVDESRVFMRMLFTVNWGEGSHRAPKARVL